VRRVQARHERHDQPLDFGNAEPAKVRQVGGKLDAGLAVAKHEALEL
jgi:hypothetical protein